MQASTLSPLVFGRHIVGMMIVALANPLIYYAQSPAADWFATWIGPVALAVVIYGLYALFFTQRAKASGAKHFLILAWVFLALLVTEPWISRGQSVKAGSANREATAPSAELPWGQNDKPVN